MTSSVPLNVISLSGPQGITSRISMPVKHGHFVAAVFRLTKMLDIKRTMIVHFTSSILMSLYTVARKRPCFTGMS